MILTEEEARTKWCPHDKTERYNNFAAHNRCIASDCMAWRWAKPIDEFDGTVVRTGYCGLAGKP